MDSTLNSYILSVTEELKNAENYQQVDQVLAASLKQAESKGFLRTEYVAKLKANILQLSPMKLNSTQFSSIRYALICLRRILKEFSVVNC